MGGQTGRASRREVTGSAPAMTSRWLLTKWDVAVKKRDSEKDFRSSGGVAIASLGGGGL
jgi:hypothetical protein